MEKSKVIMFFADYLSNPKEEHGSQPIIKRLQTLIMREELNISDVVKELVKQLDFCREELSKCIASSVYPKIITHNKQEVVNSSDPHEIQTITRIEEYFKSKTAEQLVEIAKKYDLIDKNKESKELTFEQHLQEWYGAVYPLRDIVDNITDEQIEEEVREYAAKLYE